MGLRQNAKESHGSYFIVFKVEQLLSHVDGVIFCDVAAFEGKRVTNYTMSLKFPLSNGI